VQFVKWSNGQIVETVKVVKILEAVEIVPVLIGKRYWQAVSSEQ
jgi:hypothetical protein